MKSKFILSSEKSLFLAARSRISAFSVLLLFSAAHCKSHGEIPSGPKTTTGPWGTIEYYEVTVEPPTSILWPDLFATRSYWNFGELSQGEILSLFEEFEFAPDLIEKLRNDGVWSESETGTEVEIDDKVVESLTTANRTAMAAWMRANNNEYFSKQLMNLEIHDEGLLLQRLKPSTVALIQTVTFLRNNVVSMMDRPYLIRQLGNDEQEKKALIRTLFSTRSLLARLVIDEDADIEALADYWSGGGKTPGIRSLLEGVRNAPGVGKIDLIHLLPPFARKYYCSFIQLDDVNPIGVPDCFWTSIQFFKARSTLRLLDKISIDHYLSFDFEEIDGTSTFGDMVVLFNRTDGKFIHSYVQIAGDLVFTKNGRSFARPLILTTRENMMSVYEEGYDFETRIFRRRPQT